MNSLTQPHVAVIGSGVAGLTAALGLRTAGIPVAVYEASNHVAGLATTFRDPDGFTYDFGAHFITNRFARAVGVADRCRDVSRYGEAVLLKKKIHSYPLGLMVVPRFAWSAILGKFVGPHSESKEDSVADTFKRQYGAVLAEEVAVPLVEAWSGESAKDLSPAVAEKIPDNVLHILMLRFLSKWKRKAIAIGYSREMPASHRVWHVYPEGGLRILCQHLATQLEGCIHLETPVSEIQVESGRVTGICAKGSTLPVTAVVSTAPLNVLPSLIRGTDALKHIAEFRYRAMVFVMLKFEGTNILPEVVLWTPERTFPFFRLTESSLSMPWLVPTGKTMVTADIGCIAGDGTWSMQDADLGTLCLPAIEQITPGLRARYLGCKVLRTKFAYPIFLNKYEEKRRRFQQDTGIAGLFSIGRNGEFDHLLTEDVYWRTLRRVPKIVEFLGSQTCPLPLAALHAVV